MTGSLIYLEELGAISSVMKLHSGANGSVASSMPIV